MYIYLIVWEATILLTANHRRMQKKLLQSASRTLFETIQMKPNDRVELKPPAIKFINAN